MVERIGNGELPSDKELIERVLNGDDRAFEQLLEPYRQKIHKQIRNRVHTNDVDDVYQETMLTVFRKLNTYRHESPFGNWLGSVTTNCINNHFDRFFAVKRGRGMTVSLDTKNVTPHLQAHEMLTADETYLGGNPRDAIMRKEEIARELKLIANVVDEGVREKLRALILFCQGHNNDEIATMTNVMPATVRTRIFRAKEVIRARLGLSNKSLAS